MKVLSFGRMQIQKLREKVAVFRGKLGAFMSWKKYPLLYFRRLAKELLIIFPFLFLGIFFANIFLPKSDFQNIKENILVNKNSVTDHNKLGQLFFAANDYEIAKQEFSTGSATLSALIDEPHLIKSRITYWQKLANEVPTYKDAYVKLFILNTKIYRDFDAKKILEKILELDPNFSLL